MSIGTVKIIVTEPLASPLSGFATDAELLAVDGRVEDIEQSGYFRSGTIAEREAIPLDERKAGLRFFATDQGRDYEWRLAGDASGPKRDGAALASDQWVGLYTPAEEKNLGIDFTGQLPIANVVGLSTSNAAIDDLAAIEIAGFRAEALSGDANPESELSWQIKGVQPTSQTIAWGASSIALGGDARSFRPKDWAAVKQLFVAGNSLSDSTDVTTRWAQVLAVALGVTLYSTARYSSDARQVYRTGAEPLFLTVSGGVLPTGGTPAAVSHLNGLAPSNDASVNPASFLNTGSGDTGLTTGMSMTGTIVAGSVARHGTVSIPNGASTSYSIMQDAGGAAVTLTGPVQFIPDISRQADKSDWVIWLGNNYFYSGVPNFYGDHTNPNMWVDLRKLVAKADGNRILMLPVLPATTMPLGGEVYNAMLAANARTEAFFPFARARDAMGRTLLQRLQAEGDGSANDNSDIANGWTPRSLRLSGDALHLNADGDAVVAAFVEEAFAAQTLPTAITQNTVFSLRATGANPRTDAEISDVSTAQIASGEIADLAAQISGALSNSAYFPTFAAMIASPLAVGAYFNTDDQASVGPHPGIRWIYQRTGSSPFYTAIRAWATKGDVGLSNADNTSDANKPISTAAATELAKKLEGLTRTQAQSATIPAVIKSITTTGYATVGTGAAQYKRVTAEPTILDKFRSVDRFLPDGSVSSGNGGWWELVPNGKIDVRQFGGIGDGISTDDQNVLLAAADAATATRVPMILGPGTFRTYPISRTLPVVGDTDVGRIILGPGTGFDAAGGILAINGNARGVDSRGAFTAKTAVTAAMAADATTFPVTSTAGFVVGGWALWRLGDMPYDAPETYNWGFGIVEAIGANSVTLDRPIKGAFTSDQLAAAVHNKHLYALEPVVGVDHGDMRFTADGAGATGYNVKYAIGTRTGVVEGNGVNVGTHIAQYVQGFHADAIIANNSKKVSGQELNTGAATRYAEATGHIGLLLANGCEGYASYIEAACSITIDRLHDINPIEYVSGDRRICMLVNGRSTVHVSDALFEGYGGHYAGSQQDGSTITYGSVVVNTSTPMYGIPMPGRECERLAIVHPGATDEVYSAEDGYWWEHLFVLTDTMAQTVTAPPGVLAELKFYGGGGAVADDFDAVNLYRTNDVGGGVARKSYIEANKLKSVETFAGGVGGSLWNNRANRLAFYVDTAAGRLLNGSNKFLLIQARIIPDRNATPITLQDSDFLGQYGRNFDTLFSQISTVDIPYAMSSFRSAGHSVGGMGSGIYVSDALATSGLATAHPRFCAMSKNGRYFRLAANDGMISVEQGGALGDPSETNAVNEQPIFQAAVAYCNAVGIGTIGLQSYAYSIWMPTRTSPPQTNFFHTYDGQPIIVESSQQIRFLGLHPARSRLNYRNNNGQSLAGLTPGTNFQVVSGDVWRGCGFVVKTTETDPGENKRSSLTLERLIVNGGTLKSTYFGWPARASDGDGWDTTHKGVSVEADRTYGGNVSVIDTDIIGWRGESIYSANNILAKLFTRKAYMAESNGQAVNVNGCKVDAEFSAKNCFLGIEGWTGDKGGRIVAELDNCYGIYGSSGQAFSLQGGKYGTSANSAYYAPTRINANEAPTGNIDITARYCGPGYVGAWINGRFTGIDTDLVFGGNVFGDGSFDVDLDATFVTDQVTKARPIIIGGLGGAVTAGDKRTANINLRISHVRTKLAEAAGRKALSSCTYHGSLGRGINVHIQGAVNCQRSPYPETTTQDCVPSFTGTLIDPGEYPNILQDVQATPAVAIKAPVWALYSTGSGDYEFTAAGMSSVYTAGDRVLVLNANAASGGTLIANGSKASGSGFYSPDGWFKILPGVRQWMIFDGNFFTPEGAAKGAVVSTTGATSWTPSLNDMNRIMRFTSGSAITYTVPPSSSVKYPIGAVLEIEQAGAGVITIAAGSGVTLRSRGGLLNTAGQYATAFIRKDAADEWTIYGDRA